MENQNTNSSQTQQLDITKLKTEFGFTGEIITDHTERKKFSHDASIFAVVPQFVVQPQTPADIQALVKFVQKYKPSFPGLSLTPRSGGTDMTGGSVGESIIVDFTKHLNKIVHIDQNQGVAQVEPGCYYRDFEAATLARGWLMPTYPASRLLCTVGGMVANNCGGEKSLTYGQTINFVRALEVVLDDGNLYTIKPVNAATLKEKLLLPNKEGELYRSVHALIEAHHAEIMAAQPTTSKNSAGYYIWKVWDGTTFDLTKLLVGSQGTLGIITKIEFQMVKPASHRTTIIIECPSLEPVGEIINTVLTAKPEAFELFDSHTFDLAIQYLPEILPKLSGPALQKMLLFKTELWNKWFGKNPELVLIADFVGDSEAVVQQHINQALNDLKKFSEVSARQARSNSEAQKYWIIRRESYNLLRQHNSTRVSASFIEDVAVHPDQLPTFMPALNAIMKKYTDIIYTIAGHAGDANFHIIPLMDFSNPQTRAEVEQLSREVFELVRSFNGTMTAEHNDGLVRGPFLSLMFDQTMLDLFRQVKQTFDPGKIFNPYKKIDADFDHYHAWMLRDGSGSSAYEHFS